MRLDEMKPEDAIAVRDELRNEVNERLYRKGLLVTAKDLQGESIEFVMEFTEPFTDDAAKALAGAVAGFSGPGGVIYWRKAPEISQRGEWMRIDCCFVVCPVIAVAAA